MVTNPDAKEQGGALVSYPAKVRFRYSLLRLSLGQAPLLAVKFRVRFRVRVRFGVMFRVLRAVQKVKQARLLVLLRLD